MRPRGNPPQSQVLTLIAQRPIVGAQGLGPTLTARSLRLIARGHADNKWCRMRAYAMHRPKRRCWNNDNKERRQCWEEEEEGRETPTFFSLSWARCKGGRQESRFGLWLNLITSGWLIWSLFVPRFRSIYRWEPNWKMKAWHCLIAFSSFCSWIVSLCHSWHLSMTIGKGRRKWVEGVDIKHMGRVWDLSLGQGWHCKEATGESKCV